MFPPLSLLNPFKIVRFTLFLAALFLVLISGFRSTLGMFAILFVVGSFVWGRKLDVLVAIAALCVLLSLLVTTGTIRDLPFGAQRILAVLPVDVSDDAKTNGDESSEWR